MLDTPAHRAAHSPGQLLSVTTLPAVRPGHVVVEVAGEVDSYTAPVLDACVSSRATQRDVRELVVDLRQVTFLGAAGVTVMARAHRRCRMRGARLVIRTGGRRAVLRPLQLTGLADEVVVDPAEQHSSAKRCPRTVLRKPSRPRGSSTRQLGRVCP